MQGSEPGQWPLKMAPVLLIPNNLIMQKNVGTKDIATRVIIALVFLALWGFKLIGGMFAGVLLTVGALLVLTAVIDYCPLYGLLGISSCEKDGN